MTYLSLHHDDDGDDGDVLSMMIDLMMNENENDAMMEWGNEETILVSWVEREISDDCISYMDVSD